MKKNVIKILTLLMLFGFSSLYASSPSTDTSSHEVSTKKVETYQAQSFGEMIEGFINSTGIKAFVSPSPDELSSHGEKMSDFHKSWGRIIMILIAFLLFYSS